MTGNPPSSAAQTARLPDHHGRGQRLQASDTATTTPGTAHKPR